MILLLILILVVLFIDWYVATEVTVPAIRVPRIGMLTGQALGRLAAAVSATLVSLVVVHIQVFREGFELVGWEKGTRLLPDGTTAWVLLLALLLPSLVNLYYLPKIIQWKRAEREATHPLRRRDDTA